MDEDDIIRVEMTPEMVGELLAPVLGEYIKDTVGLPEGTGLMFVFHWPVGTEADEVVLIVKGFMADLPGEGDQVH